MPGNIQTHFAVAFLHDLYRKNAVSVAQTMLKPHVLRTIVVPWCKRNILSNGDSTTAGPITANRVSSTNIPKLRNIPFIFISTQSINQSAGNCPIRINSPVAQKRPVATRIFQQAQINFSNQDFFLVVRSFCDHPAKRISNERSAPELQTFAGSFVSANIALFESDAIYHCNINSVGNCMGSLNCLPGVVLCLAEFFFLVRMPANRRRIENHLRTLQSRQPCPFGIPLVPTY